MLKWNSRSRHFVNTRCLIPLMYFLETFKNKRKNSKGNMDITSCSCNRLPTLVILPHSQHTTQPVTCFGAHRGSKPLFGPAHTAYGSAQIPKDKMKLQGHTAVPPPGHHAITSWIHTVSSEMHKCLLPINLALRNGDKVHALQSIFNITDSRVSLPLEIQRIHGSYWRKTLTG